MSVIDATRPAPPAAAQPAPAPAAPAKSRLGLYGWLALAAVAATQAIAVALSPADAAMGHTQKIMYVHVPTAWCAFLAFGIVFAYSVLYLWKNEQKHDDAALAAAEVGTALTALTLAQGSIWGRPTWGIWWTWDPRLTATAILFLIYSGYLALRAFSEEAERRARWSAAVGVLAFLNVPIVYLSVRWWRTLHQVQSTPASVDPMYAWGLRLNALAFMLLLVYFVARTYHASLLEQRGEELAEREALGGERRLAAGGLHA